MAGLGTQNQKSVAPLVRRVQLRSAYNFLCLLYAKWSTRNKNGPHGVSHSPPVIQFDGPNFLFNVTPQYKNQVKLSAATLFWPYMPNPAIRQKRSKTVLDGVEDDDEETDTNQDKGEATATVQSLPTFAAQYKVVTDYLERQGFGPDDTPPKGYDRESVTKFLVEKGYCTSESAASSIIPTANTNLAEKQPKKKRPAVKSNAAATSKRKKTAATSFVPETQEDTLVPDTSTADTSFDPSILIALERANTKVPHTKKPKKASSTTHKSKRAPMPVMAPNQKPSTLTSEQAGTCAFYKEYLKAAVHAIAPQDPPQQPFFYVGRGQHDACRWLTDRYWNFHI